jgi:hypothetical protein
MLTSIGAISRIFVLAAVAGLTACGGTSHKIDTSGPGANPGDNTVVTTIPDAPAPDTASLSPGPELVTIQKNIWDDYQLYLSRVGQVGSGYYAITEDGLGGASWSCSEALCDQENQGLANAMKQCQDANPGKSCIVFAKDNHPQVRYEIAQ